MSCVIDYHIRMVTNVEEFMNGYQMKEVNRDISHQYFDFMFPMMDNRF